MFLIRRLKQKCAEFVDYLRTEFAAAWQGRRWLKQPGFPNRSTSLDPEISASSGEAKLPTDAQSSLKIRNRQSLIRNPVYELGTQSHQLGKTTTLAKVCWGMGHISLDRQDIYLLTLGAK